MTRESVFLKKQCLGEWDDGFVLKRTLEYRGSRGRRMLARKPVAV